MNTLPEQTAYELFYNEVFIRTQLDMASQAHNGKNTISEHPYLYEPAYKLFLRRPIELNSWIQNVSPTSYSLSHMAG